MALSDMFKREFKRRGGNGGNQPSFSVSRQREEEAKRRQKEQEERRRAEKERKRKEQEERKRKNEEIRKAQEERRRKKQEQEYTNKQGNMNGRKHLSWEHTYGMNPMSRANTEWRQDQKNKGFKENKLYNAVGQIQSGTAHSLQGLGNAVGAVDYRITGNDKHYKDIQNSKTHQALQNIENAEHQFNRLDSNNAENKFDKVAGDLLFSTGTQLPSAAAAALTGGASLGADAARNASLGVMGAHVFGNSTDELLKQGYDIKHATRGGLFDAGTEIGTEMLPLDKIPGLNKFVDQKWVPGMDTNFRGMLGEGVEEYIGERVGGLRDLVTEDDPNAKQILSDNLVWKDDNFAQAMKAGAMGVGGALTTGLVTRPISTVQNFKDDFRHIDNRIHNTNEFLRQETPYGPMGDFVEMLQQQQQDIQQRLQDGRTIPIEEMNDFYEKTELLKMYISAFDQQQFHEAEHGIYKDAAENAQAVDNDLNDRLYETYEAEQQRNAKWQQEIEDALRESELAKQGKETFKDLEDYRQRKADLEEAFTDLDDFKRWNEQAKQRDEQVRAEQEQKYNDVFENLNDFEMEKLKEQLSKERHEANVKNNVVGDPHSSREHASRINDYTKAQESIQKSNIAQQAVDQVLNSLSKRGVELTPEQQQMIKQDVLTSKGFYDVTGITQETPKYKLDGLDNKQNRAVRKVYTEDVNHVIEHDGNIVNDTDKPQLDRRRLAKDVYGDDYVLPQNENSRKDNLDNYKNVSSDDLNVFKDKGDRLEAVENNRPKEKPDFDTSQKIELTKEQIEKYANLPTEKPLIEKVKPTKFAQEIYPFIRYKVENALNDTFMADDFANEKTWYGIEGIIKGQNKKMTYPLLKGLQRELNADIKNTTWQLKYGTNSLDESNAKLNVLQQMQRSINNELIKMKYNAEVDKVRKPIEEKVLKELEKKEFDISALDGGYAKVENETKNQLKATSLESLQAYKEDYMNKLNSGDKRFKAAQNELERQLKALSNEVEAEEAEKHYEELESDYGDDFEQFDEWERSQGKAVVDEPVYDDRMDKNTSAIDDKRIQGVNDYKRYQENKVEFEKRREAHADYLREKYADELLNKHIDEENKKWGEKINAQWAESDRKAKSDIEQDLNREYEKDFNKYKQEMEDTLKKKFKKQAKAKNIKVEKGSVEEKIVNENANKQAKAQAVVDEVKRKVKTESKQTRQKTTIEPNFESVKETLHETIKGPAYADEHTITTFEKLIERGELPKSIEKIFKKLVDEKDITVQNRTVNFKELENNADAEIDRVGYAQAMEQFLKATADTDYGKKIDSELEKHYDEQFKKTGNAEETAREYAYTQTILSNEGIALGNALNRRAEANLSAVKTASNQLMKSLIDKGFKIVPANDGHVRLFSKDGTDVTNSHAEVVQDLNNLADVATRLNTEISMTGASQYKTTSNAGALLSQARTFYTKQEQALNGVEQGVNTINEEIARRNKSGMFKKADYVVIDDALKSRLVQAKTDAERAEAIEAIQRDIAKQLPWTFKDWYNQQRYFAMLFNPKTHLRNIVGNATTGVLFDIKDSIYSGIESHLKNSGKVYDMNLDMNNAQHAKIYERVTDYLSPKEQPGISFAEDGSTYYEKGLKFNDKLHNDYQQYLDNQSHLNKEEFFKSKGYTGKLLKALVEDKATKVNDLGVFKDERSKNELFKTVASTLVDHGITVNANGELVDKSGSKIDIGDFYNEGYNNLHDSFMTSEHLRMGKLSRAEMKTNTEFAQKVFEEKKLHQEVEKNTKFLINEGAKQYRNYWGDSWWFGRTMGKLGNWNTMLLNLEDIKPALQPRYEKVFAKKLKAQGYTVIDGKLSKNGRFLTPTVQSEVVDNISKTALQEAQEATFHDHSVVAEELCKISNMKFIGTPFRILQPFITTPVNVARRGVEFSPIWLAKSMTTFQKNVQSGNVEVAINDLCKGLTGTGISMIGAFLFKAGILTFNDGDDDDSTKYEKFKQTMLGQRGATISLFGREWGMGWTSAFATPLIIGAYTAKWIEDASDKTETKKEIDVLTSACELLGGMAGPYADLSFMTGVSSVLAASARGTDPSEKASNALYAFGSNAVSQTLPQIGGAINRTIEPEVKGSYSPNKTEYMINQIRQKIPGLNKGMVSEVDYKGDSKLTRGGNSLLWRFLDNTIGIAPVTQKNDDPMLNEIDRVYQHNKNDKIIPQTIPSNRMITVGGEKVRVSAQERHDINEAVGKTWTKHATEFMNSGYYQSLDDNQREKILAQISSFASEKGKDEYFKSAGLGSAMSNANQKCEKAMNKHGLSAYQYFNLYNIDSLKDENGDTINGSRALLKRDQLEKYGLGDIDPSEAYELFGVSEKTMNMSEEEFSIRMQYIDHYLTKKQLKAIMNGEEVDLSATTDTNKSSGSGSGSRKGRKGRKGKDPQALYDKIVSKGLRDAVNEENRKSKDLAKQLKKSLRVETYKNTVYRPKRDEKLDLYGMKLKSDI